MSTKANTRSVGTAYERKACDFLEQQGYEIVTTNFRCRAGEVDIIARQKEYLCFIEVKYRRKSQTGAPEEAVDFRKQNRICRVADYYMISHSLPASCNIRFDVVAMLGEDTRLYQNAFGYIGR